MAELDYASDDRIYGQTDGAMEYGMITYQLRSKAITEKMQAEFIEVGEGKASDKIGDINSESFLSAFEYSDNEILTLTFDNTFGDASDFRKLAKACIDFAEKIEADTKKDLIVYCF